MPPASMLDLERTLCARFERPLPGAAAQHRFAMRPARDGWAPDLQPQGARHAAALLLVYPGPDGPAIPLTVRHADISRHPGQVSLPSGAIDAGESRVAAALREAEEEIGVRPQDVRLVGALSTVWVPVSNFVIHPLVGVTDTTPNFRAHPREVSAVISATVDQLRAADAVKWGRRLLADGAAADYPYFDIARQTVWGATAVILGEFIALFEPGTSS